ncbi:MAG: glycosyltransferase [Caldilineaceae bacterium]
MAKILLHTLVFAPDGVSTAQLMTELALELQAQGHEVTVLTSTPHYNVEPEGAGAPAADPALGRAALHQRAQRHPRLSRLDSGQGGAGGARLLDYLRFHAISTLAGLLTVGHYDVLLVPSPPLTIGLSAWLLGLRRVPFIYNVQEIYPDVAVSLGVLQNQRLISVLERLERFICSRPRRLRSSPNGSVAACWPRGQKAPSSA